MTTNEEIEVDSSNGVFLAVAAQNYADADLAFWRLKQDLGARGLENYTLSQHGHLEKMRQRRKETYADLVAWVMLVEAERVGNVAPSSPAKARSVGNVINNVMITGPSDPNAAAAVRAEMAKSAAAQARRARGDSV